MISGNADGLICVTCGPSEVLDAHHPVGRERVPTATVPLCRGCHDEQSERQRDAGVELTAAPPSPAGICGRSRSVSSRSCPRPRTASREAPLTNVPSALLWAWYARSSARVPRRSRLGLVPTRSRTRSVTRGARGVIDGVPHVPGQRRTNKRASRSPVLQCAPCSTPWRRSSTRWLGTEARTRSSRV